MADSVVDARGMRCPWPALRLARVLRSAAPGVVVTMLADDPKAPDELAELAAAQGWIFASAVEGDGWRFTLSR